MNKLLAMLGFMLGLVTWKDMEEERKSIRQDEAGTLDPAAWTYAIIMIVVVLLIVAALFATLSSSLTKYAANETTFGPVLKTLVPILIGAGLLLVIVAAVLPRMGKGF